MKRKTITNLLSKTVLKGCFLLFLALFSTGLTAQITVDVSNKSIKEILKEVETKSEYRFFYNESLKGLDKISSLRVKDATIDKTMLILLEKTEINYKLEKKNLIVLVAKTKIIQSESKKITGLVTDEKGDPIIGASVKLEKSNIGTITDLNGKFNIDAPISGKLSISYIGYVSASLSIAGKSDYKIILQEDSKDLDEIVVVGYGTQKKISLTGSIATVKGSDIIATKNENITNMLAGKMSGVRVIQTSGEPGSYASTIQIRGMGSPLVIVDGVPRDNMAMLDPNEIENISVLKDGSAAIYGVRASNGVILITTKKGEKGKTQIEYTGYYGFQSPTNRPQGLNALQYMDLTNENNVMRGSLPYGQMEYSNKEMDKYRNGVLKGSDWGSINTNYLAPQSRHNISASGSVAKLADYFVNFSYLKQDGVYSTGDLNYERYNLRSNLTSKLNDNLKLEILVGAIADTKNSPYTGNENFWRVVLTEKPILPSLANNTSPFYQNINQGFNPYIITNSDLNGYQRNNHKSFQSTGNLIWEVPFIKGLQAKASYSYDYNLWDNKSLQKPYQLFDYDPVTKAYRASNYGNMTQISNSYINRSARFLSSTLMQMSLNYNHVFNSVHTIQLLGLYEEGSYNMDNFSASRFIEMTSIEELFGGVNNGQVGGMDGSGYNPNLKPAEQGGFWQIANKALVGRANYNYKSKYYAEVAFRYDGSSKFAPGHQWGFFPSVSTAWRISEEPFIKNNYDFINNLKLRASYGVSGDDATATFQFVPGFNYPVNSTDWWPILFNNEPQPQLSLRGTPNTNLTWYTAKNMNIGLDFDLWNGLLGFEGDIFSRKRDGLLATRLVKIPDWLGESLAAENLNSDETLGFDFLIKHNNEIGKLKYGASFNFGLARSRNQYVERTESTNQWDNWKNNPTNRYNDIWWGINSPGQFQNYSEIWSSPIIDSKGNSGFKPGDYKYEDWNGDGVIDDLDNHPITSGTLSAQNIPMISYGLSLNAQYLNFDFNVVFQGGALSNVRYEGFLATPFTENKNGPSYFFDRWHMQNPLADPKDPRTDWVPGYLPTTSQGSPAMLYNTINSNSSIHRSDYVRCKSIELGYTVPANVIKLAGLQGARFFCSAYNLFTITGLKYQDPEHPSSNLGLMYPLMLTVNTGVSLKF